MIFAVGTVPSAVLIYIGRKTKTSSEISPNRSNGGDKSERSSIWKMRP